MQYTKKGFAIYLVLFSDKNNNPKRLSNDAVTVKQKRNSYGQNNF